MFHDLNTSHVDIQDVSINIEYEPEGDLNTSHVDIQGLK